MRFLATWFVVLLCVGSLAARAQDAAPAEDPALHLDPVLLKIARDPQVHAELRLDGPTRDLVLAATDAVDGDWWRSRNLAPDERRTVIDGLTKNLRGALREGLAKQARKRLFQLELRAQGTRVLQRDDLARALGLDDAVRTKLAQVATESSRLATEAGAPISAGTATDDERAAITERLTELQRDEQRKGLALLSPEQQQKLIEYLGEPFDMTRLKRHYPRAPELVDAGGEWLQGGPQRVSDLRGKVVAVHFYAFQCINCVRNLPHYKQWSETFAAEDLVVIGVQTPETATEREPESVAEAMRRDGITYPVLLDSDSATWRAWGNTMWPTVYLVDRDGYLRSWWQGEMNWQGTPGEERMRGYIRELLDEKPASLATR
ncbi:MAG: redoxin domain-containing protein [Lacipirellulaceae bacterium]